jgi:hypothetical protein
MPLAASSAAALFPARSAECEIEIAVLRGRHSSARRFAGSSAVSGKETVNGCS